MFYIIVIYNVFLLSIVGGIMWCEKLLLEFWWSFRASSLSDLQRKNLIIEDKKFAPKKLKLFNFNRLPHQVRQAARQDV